MANKTHLNQQYQPFMDRHVVLRMVYLYSTYTFCRLTFHVRDFLSSFFLKVCKNSSSSQINLNLRIISTVRGSERHTDRPFRCFERCAGILAEQFLEGRGNQKGCKEAAAIRI
jgi:hypothetical protein